MLNIMKINLDHNLKIIIYNYLPVILVKYCNKESYKKYLNASLPDKYNDWSIGWRMPPALSVLLL
jgi:hypothetical protein